MSQQGILQENSGALPNIETITGNSGGAVGPDAGFNINLLATNTNTVVGVPGTNTLTVTPTSAGYPITPFVVGPINQAGYQTIQSALNAIGAGGSGHIWIYPGTYTENLIFPNGINVGLITGSDEDAGAASIVGVHTPPTTGNVVIWRVKMTSATHIFNSAAAGTSDITIAHNNYSTNGYIFNLPNWTSAGSFTIFAIGDRASTSDGVVNNIGGASVLIFQSAVGVGVANPMIVNGLLVIEGCDISCPIQTSSSTALEIAFSNFFANIQLGGSSSGYIVTSLIQTGSAAGITYNSSGNTLLATSTINSSNNPSISGTSAGTLSLVGVTYVNNSAVAGTVTATNPGLIDVGSIRSNFTNNSLLLGGGTRGTITSLGAAINGQIPIGSTGANPVLTTLSAGTGISISNAAGSITIATIAGGFLWNVIGVSQTLVAQNGYFCTSGAALSLALPAVSAVGDTIQVALDGSTSWTITQPNAATRIRIGNTQTTLGVGGSLSSTAQGDTIELVCETANARWCVTDIIGNITVV